MSLASTFEGFQIPDNSSPQPMPIVGHVLQSGLFPVGVFYYATTPRKSQPDESVSMALPLAVNLKVSWLAEPGILYVHGAVGCVGKAFEHTTKYRKDFAVDATSTMPFEVQEAIGGSKVEFTEFVNNYFAAVRRAVAVTDEIVHRLQEKLCHAFSDFRATGDEEEMRVAIKMHMAQPPKPKPKEEVPPPEEPDDES